jgi:hypothetical protein
VERDSLRVVRAAAHLCQERDWTSVREIAGARQSRTVIDRVRRLLRR